MTTPDRESLEALWSGRLADAKLRLDFARQYMNEVQQDLSSLPPPDGDFVYQRALRAERFALRQYRQVLRIFTDLVVRGKVPDEQAASAGGALPPMDEG